jgi:hypothetical protein
VEKADDDVFQEKGGEMKAKLSVLKKKAWAEFSRYIRLKYSTADGYCRCVTCGAIMHWKSAQASHFVPGRSNAILFDERGVYPACYACNVCKHGNIHNYMIFLERRLGVDVARALRDELLQNAKNPLKRTAEDLIQIREEYKKKADELQRGEG